MASAGRGRGRGRGLLAANVGSAPKPGPQGDGETTKVCKDYRVIISFEFPLLVFKTCRSINYYYHVFDVDQLLMLKM